MIAVMEQRLIQDRIQTDECSDTPVVTCKEKTDVYPNSDAGDQRDCF